MNQRRCLPNRCSRRNSAETFDLLAHDPGPKAVAMQMKPALSGDQEQLRKRSPPRDAMQGLKKEILGAYTQCDRAADRTDLSRTERICGPL